MIRRAIAAAVLVSFASVNAGCYSGDWSFQTVRSPSIHSRVNYGSTLQALDQDPSAAGAVVRVAERPSCRVAQRGTVIEVGHKGARRSSWPLALDILGIITAGGVGVYALAANDSAQPDSKAASVGTGALVLGAVSLGHLLVWLTLPSVITSEQHKTVGTYASWSSRPKPCGAAVPVHAAVPLHFDLLSNDATIASWPVVTDSNGRYVDKAGIVPTARKIAAWCNAPQLLLTDSEISTPAGEQGVDTPDAPHGATRRHGAPLLLDLAIPGGGRPTIAEITKENAAAGALARQCCAVRMARIYADTCTDLCIRAAGAGQCANGRQACEAGARGTEFAADGLALCNRLLSSCLNEHDSGMRQLEVCKVTCSADKVTEGCQ